MSDTIETLLNQQSALWRGSDKPCRNLNVLKTGFPQLDQLIQAGGWPIGISTELLLSESGIGELRLLLPALQQQQTQGHSVWINPAFQPFAPSLTAQKIDISKLWLIKAHNLHDVLWSCEQALLNKACNTVFCWLGDHRVQGKDLKKLNLAAQDSQTWLVFFRDIKQLQSASPSPFRLSIDIDRFSRLLLNIHKQPRAWTNQQCRISLEPHYEHWQRLPSHLLAINNHHPRPDIKFELTPKLSDGNNVVSVLQHSQPH